MGEVDDEERRSEKVEGNDKNFSCSLLQFLEMFVLMMTVSKYMITCGFSSNSFFIGEYQVYGPNLIIWAHV